jgi:ubiquinol-cytochrome c reductase cytochrome c1 subunit
MFQRLAQTVKASPRAAAIAKGLAVGAGLAAASGGVVLASDTHALPKYPWSHGGFFDSFDHASIRRGFEVYRQVCSTCHSMKYKAYRQLVGVSHTEEQAKAIARSITVKDGPNEEGEMFERPGKLFDHFPSPYPNDEYAAFINGGAIPPDLSLIVLGRPGGEDYVFSLLNGYHPEPAGVTLRQGLNYNVYFPGGAISMAKPLNDGQVEWEDGTPATETQMAKDVVTFLSWAAQPEHDDRKLLGAKFVLGVGLAALLLGYQKRLYWSVIKTQRISYPPSSM